MDGRKDYCQWDGIACIGSKHRRRTKVVASLCITSTRPAHANISKEPSQASRSTIELSHLIKHTPFLQALLK
jgi:hypothetical protein